MKERSENYPLNISDRFRPDPMPPFDPTSQRPAEFRKAAFTNPLYFFLRKTVENSHWALAFCDIIDRAQETAADRMLNTDAAIAGLTDALAATRSDISALTGSVAALTAFLAATVPAWATKAEVENGDDMGIARPSAAALGLTVEFASVRQQPGFGHEDVVSIEPPAGTLVAKGSTVTVTLNLEG